MYIGLINNKEKSKKITKKKQKKEEVIPVFEEANNGLSWQKTVFVLPETLKLKSCHGTQTLLISRKILFSLNK